MKKSSKPIKYSDGGIIPKKKVDYANTTANPIQGGKSVTGDPHLQVGPHLYELPKKFIPVQNNPKTIDSNRTNNTSKPKIKLKNPRQKGYVDGGSSSMFKSKVGNANKGKATSNSKTCTTSSCSKF